MAKVTRGGPSDVSAPPEPIPELAAEPEFAAAEADEEEPDTSPAAVRAWAAGQGIDLPATGRIPKAVRDAHYAAVTGEAGGE